MDLWIIGLATNTFMALAYAGIVGFIVVPLMRSRQLSKNKLGAATDFLSWNMYTVSLYLRLSVAKSAPLRGQ